MRVKRGVYYALVVASVVFAAHINGVHLSALFDTTSLRSIGPVFKGLVHPDLSSEFLWRVAKLSLDSVLIGVLSTALALLIGVSSAVLTIRLPKLQDSPERAPIRDAIFTLFRLTVRAILALFRSVPEVVWALLFVRMFGLGPGAAVLAIALVNGGVFGKLFAEVGEAVEPESIRALQRVGVKRTGLVMFGLLPQIWRQWASYSFYRLECSVRSASILGIVGAGGLGSEIALSVRYFQYEQLATCILAILAFVILIEIAGALLKQRSFYWTAGLLCLGSIAAVVRLDIPWSSLLHTSLLPDWLIHSKAGSEGMLTKGIRLAGQTVLMAWCATWAAAAVALVLSPLNTTRMSLRGRRRDSIRGRFGPGVLLDWLVFGVARFIMQITRALPELALALVFVVWVGPGTFAGVLAIGVHTVGVLGRLFTDVYEEVEPERVGALESMGTSRLGTWLFGIFPQAAPRLLSFTLYRFEVNVRATAMVGFVGAGGIGDAIDTAISFFHGRDLLVLMGVMFCVVVILDFIGDRVRHRILTSRFATASRIQVAPQEPLPEMNPRRRAPRQARAKGVRFRLRGLPEFGHGTVRSLSDLGMFIETPQPCNKDEVIEIALQQRELTTDGDYLDEVALGRVVYVRNDDVPGMGVELIAPFRTVSAREQAAHAETAAAVAAGAEPTQPSDDDAGSD